MTTVTPLLEAEVSALVSDWYARLDVHAPVEEVLPLLADAELEMQFPEGRLRGHAGFRQWYDTVTRKFFDEVHDLKTVQVKVDGDRADVSLVVNWQARMWDPPAAKSVWLGFDAAQRWVVRRAPASGRPVIVTYIVDALTPMQGSALL